MASELILIVEDNPSNLQLAEFILKAAAQGQTSYDGLLAAASGQIQTILSMLT